MNLLDIHAMPLSADANEDAPQRSPAMAVPPRAPRVRMISSEQLFADFPEVQIAHGDAIYRLRQTSLGKLILTK